MKTYTFHVSLPGYGRLWRKLELPAESTLEDLHLAIQDAYGFDNDHLYSFFMSGKPWDASSEFTLPEEVGPMGLELEDEEEPELLADGVDPSAEALTAESMRILADAMRDNPEKQAQLQQAMMSSLGLPAGLAESFVNNLTAMIDSSSDDELNDLLSGSFWDDEEDEEPGDVRFTTLESLGLRKSQTFLYLFDYGDEWRFKVKVDAVNDRADERASYPRLVQSVGEAPQQYGDAWNEDDEDGEGYEEE